MKPYPSYKESRVDWIGDIPSRWDVRRLKYVFNGREERSLTGEEELLSVTINDGVVRRRDYVNSDDHLSRSSSLVGYKICHQGDLVNNIMKMGFRCLGISGYDGMVSPAYSVFYFTDKRNISKYWNYLLRTDLFVTEYKKRSKGIQESRMRLYDDYFTDIYSLVPSIQEQQQISNYLDHKTQQIDSLIEKTQQKIELLKEQRTSMINQVVTKGLNPDVEMKDSGVEWIGEIPRGWDVVKGKYILKILTGNSPDKLIENESGISFIKVNDLNHTVDGYYLEGSSLSIDPDSKYPLEKNILLFPKRGMTIFTNKIVISRIEGFIDPNLMGVKVFENSNIKYVFNVIKSRGLGDICDSSTIPQINNKHIYPLQFPFPPPHEQQQIVDYLDQETTKIDSLIEKETQRIDLLKEYRQSLISEVVTGKVDIRGYDG